MKKKIIIISGGPGFGKSKIIRELGKLGFTVSAEYAREIIEEQTLQGGNILPWKDIKAFQHEVLKRRIAFFESVKEGEIAFADRGIPDQIAFARYRGFTAPSILKESLKKLEYENLVFITAPWKEIYKPDHIRRESFEEACQMHRIICDVYRELGFEMVDIPQIDVNSRARFILSYLKKSGIELE